MTNKKKKKNKWGGATRGQLALIGVLLVVLACVIGAQLTGGSDEPSSAARKKRTRTRAANVAAASSQEESAEQAEERTWPEYGVGQLIAFDPLARTDWYLDAIEVQANQAEGALVKKVVEKLELNKLQESGTNIVLIDDQHRIATVGEQRIRVGDKIDGYQVSEITDQGVVLKKSRSH